MFLRNLLDLMSPEEKKNKKVEAGQKFVIGMGIAIAAFAALGIVYTTKSGKGVLKNMKRKTLEISESIQNTALNGSEDVQNSAKHAAQKVIDVIDDADDKSEVINENVKHGFHEISKDIHKTAENIFKRQ